MSDVIFTTLHGSRLYGFSHARSDFDTFTVTTSRAAGARQTIDANGNDRVVVGLDAFLSLAMSGSHQSVEALFSPFKEWGEHPLAQSYRPMLESIRVSGGSVFAKYERTIKKFSYGDFKRRRHAARLRINLAELRREGSIRPHLTDKAARGCALVADALAGDELVALLLP